MTDKSKSEKPSITLPGTVEKIIPGAQVLGIPEKAEILIEGADDLYREVRVQNILEDENGKKLKLKRGAHVDVTIEADPQQTQPTK